jgi:hypothetical protein
MVLVGGGESQGEFGNEVAQEAAAGTERYMEGLIFQNREQCGAASTD